MKVKNISSAYTITVADHLSDIEVTGAVTITLSSPSDIAEFDCNIIALTGIITFAGYMGGTIAAGCSAKLIGNGATWKLTAMDEGTTSLPLSVAKGGTGVATLALIKTLLGIDTPTAQNDFLLGNAAGTAFEKKNLVDTKTILGLFPNILPQATPVNAVAARATLTVTAGGSIIQDGFTVLIDTKTYTFKTNVGTTEGNVLIGATDTTALANLLAAINHTGTPNTDYYCAAVHPTASGISSNALTLIASIKIKGVAGNSVASVATGTGLSFNAATFGTTVVGVNGTVGTACSVYADTSYLYYAIAANTIDDTNWRRVTLGSAY